MKMIAMIAAVLRTASAVASVVAFAVASAVAEVIAIRGYQCLVAGIKLHHHICRSTSTAGRRSTKASPKDLHSAVVTEFGLPASSDFP